MLPTPAIVAVIKCVSEVSLNHVDPGRDLGAFLQWIRMQQYCWGPFRIGACQNDVLVSPDAFINVGRGAVAPTCELQIAPWPGRLAPGRSRHSENLSDPNFHSNENGPIEPSLLDRCCHTRLQNRIAVEP